MTSPRRRRAQLSYLERLRQQSQLTQLLRLPASSTATCLSLDAAGFGLGDFP